MTLTFAQGAVTSLVGPNGAGKTTLFNAITGLIRPTAGRVFLGAADVTGRPPHAIARLGIGRGFQHTRILQQLTVLQNVQLALPEVSDRVLAMAALSAARRERLRDDARRHLVEAGLADVADRPAHMLGYGEQRAVMIACRVASGARILLLDEPTSGIDPGARGRILSLVRTLRDGGRTILLIEHNLDVIRGASDQVVFMAEGRVRAIGTAAEIESDPELTTLYFGGAVHA